MYKNIPKRFEIKWISDIMKMELSNEIPIRYNR